ncbi:MAG: S41 family peptidase [Candidatus Kaelpia aquatica]|nr:S41 family peptidase [Candidatus Kaelpia aquatica]
MKRVLFLIVIAIAISITLHNIPSYSLDVDINKPSKSNDQDLYSNLEVFSDVIALIQQEYVEEETPKDIIYGALQGMLGALDPYSQFLEPDLYQELRVETEGEFGGIGIVIAIKTGVLTIISPLEGTPGYEAGLQAGDRIVKIGDESTKGITLMEAVKKLRGKPKTEVAITVLRESEQRLIGFKIIRDIVKIESVKEVRVINDDIGYIKILEFQENTLPDFKKALKSFKDKKIEGLIVDLRNNPGGLLDIAVAITSEFLPKGDLVVYTQGRNAKQDMRFHSGGGSFIKAPLIVLINKGSASGSEILAGAIKDNNRGLIIGQTSFGKASVQTIIPLKDNSAVRLTTAHYYTPSGNLIHEKGVEPDVKIDKKRIKALLEDASSELDTETMFEDIEEGKEEISLEEKEDKLDFELEQAINIMKGLVKYNKMLSES